MKRKVFLPLWLQTLWNPRVQGWQDAGWVSSQILPSAFQAASFLPRNAIYNTSLFTTTCLLFFLSFDLFKLTSSNKKLTLSNSLPHRSQCWYFQTLFIASIQLNKGKRKVKKLLWHIVNAIILFCTAPDWSSNGDSRPQKDPLYKQFIFRLIKISSLSLKLRHTWHFTMRTLCKTAHCEEPSLKHFFKSTSSPCRLNTCLFPDTELSLVYLSTSSGLPGSGHRPFPAGAEQTAQDGVQPGYAECTQCQRSHSGQAHRTRTAFWLTAIALTLPTNSFHEAVVLWTYLKTSQTALPAFRSGAVCSLFLCPT